MVLTKSELIALLQKEVRVLLHLVSKIDSSMLDYRPTPKQRSTLELLQYLTNMGPTLIQYAKGQPLDAAAMAKAIEIANARDFDETVIALAAHSDIYAELLADMSDDDFRGATTGFDGLPVTRGQFLVNHVIGQCAAYRTTVSLPESLWPRRAEHDESLGRRGRPDTVVANETTEGVAGHCRDPRGFLRQHRRWTLHEEAYARPGE